MRARARSGEKPCILFLRCSCVECGMAHTRLSAERYHHTKPHEAQPPAPAGAAQGSASARSLEADRGARARPARQPPRAAAGVSGCAASGDPPRPPSAPLRTAVCALPRRRSTGRAVSNKGEPLKNLLYFVHAESHVRLLRFYIGNPSSSMHNPAIDMELDGSPPPLSPAPPPMLLPLPNF